ncbi:hypothetical protein [Paraburkholderia sp. HD33-4]|nr:hypothetical protein [Paraburkholderia sp. HD33-4]
MIKVTSVAGLMGYRGNTLPLHGVEGWSDELPAEVQPLGVGRSASNAD